MKLNIIIGEKIEDKLINDPRHPLLAIKQAQAFIDDMLKQQHGTIQQKCSNSSATVSCLYYYGKSKGIDVHIFQNDLSHEISIDQAFQDWNRSYELLDKLCEGSELY